MSTVNNRNKKYWIRYNPGADRLEQEITSGGKRPKGPGWITVPVDRCCDTLQQRVFEADVELGGGGCDCTFVLGFDLDDNPLGLELIIGSFVHTNTTIENAINALNSEYEGFATFELISGITIKVTLLVDTNEHITFTTGCNCD